MWQLGTSLTTIAPWATSNLFPSLRANYVNKHPLTRGSKIEGLRQPIRQASMEHHWPSRDQRRAKSDK